MATSTGNYIKLRSNLLELIREDEHSDLPTKKFRIKKYYIQPSLNDNTELELTIKAKTRIGAVIAYADWYVKKDTPIFWRHFIDTLREEKLMENNELKPGISIQQCADVLVEEMFSGNTDDVIVEIIPKTISPFPDEL
jgi:hypothetical protein